MKTSFAALAVLAALAAAPTLPACTDDTGSDDDTAGTSYEEIAARAHFDLWQETSGAYVFQFVSAAGESLLDSQDYASRTAALNGPSARARAPRAAPRTGRARRRRPAPADLTTVVGHFANRRDPQ